MKILLVEDQAHLLRGHHPTLVLQVANALHSVGSDVTVLVRRSGSTEQSDVRLAPGVKVRTYPRPLRELAEYATRLQKRGSAPGRVGATMKLVAGIILHATPALAVWYQLRSEHGETRVIELSHTSDPLYRTLLAPRKTHWAVYEFLPPRRRRSLQLQWVAHRVEQWRRRAGGSVRVVANNRPVLNGWTTAVPWLEIAVAPVAMVADSENCASTTTNTARMDGEGDQSRVTDGARPLALVFGSSHAAKDLQTVIAAYDSRDVPGRVLLAGVGTSGEVLSYRADHPDCDLSAVTTLDGYVDEQTKNRLYGDADLAILSFAPSIPNDSGTLCDAVAHGLPVCCSEPSAPAEEVVEYGLGLVFPCGDPFRLRESVKAVVAGECTDTEGQNRFRSNRSAVNVANSLLRAAAGVD